MIPIKAMEPRLNEAYAMKAPLAPPTKENCSPAPGTTPAPPEPVAAAASAARKARRRLQAALEQLSAYPAKD